MSTTYARPAYTRRPQRVRLLLLAPVVALLALLLPWSTSPVQAYVPPPAPPVVVSTLLGGVESYWTLPAGVAAEPLSLTMAGVGAYQGTCMALGQMFGGSCDAAGAVDSIWNLVTTGSWYGTPASYTGPSALIGHAQYAGPSTAFPVTLFSSQYNQATFRFTFQYTTGSQAYNSSSQCRVDVTKGTGATSQTATVSNGNSVSATLATNTGTGWTAATFSGATVCQDSTPKALTRVQAFNGCCELVADWVTGAAGPRQWTATYTETCTTPGGSTFTRTTSVNWTPTAGGKSPDAHLPNCWDITPGSVRTQVGVSAGPTGDTAVQTATIPTVDPSYAACVSTMCALTPLYVPTGVRCYSAASDTHAAQDCVDQWPERDGHKTDWQCWYGQYRVALSVCLQTYTPTYFATGDPAPSPSPTTAPQPTVAPLPTNGANPTAPPETDVPGLGTAPAPGPGGNDANCWGSGWSWNPVSWVVVPVECSLKWAFVPSQTVLQDSINSAKASFANSTPGKWWAALGGLTPPAGAAGCAGPSVDFTVYGKPFHAEPLNACSGAMSTFANGAKLFISAGVVLFGGFACIRVLGAGLGWNSNVGGA